MRKHQDLVAVAATAARRAAAIIRTAPRPAPAAWVHKSGPADFVTEVDREAERAIRDVVLDAYPDSTLRGEELSPDAGTSGLLWVVDPLDGTTNYLHGYPAFAVSIAAVVDDAPVAAVVLDVNRDRLYHATTGEGAWLDDDRLAVSLVRDPALALIGTGFPFKWPDLLPHYLEQFSRVLRATSGIRRAGAASLDFVDVALGRLDGFWEVMLAPWDVAAGGLIVREAGGVVSGPDGNGALVRHGAFVAGNPTIHGWLCHLLADSAPRAPSPA